MVQPGDLMMMYGTTTFFVLVLDRPLPASRPVWNTPYILPGLHNLEFGTATTGAFTRWFRDNFARPEPGRQAAGGPEAYSVLTAEAARVPPGSQGLVILPYLSGERSPLHDPDARGVVVGLSLAHGRGHLYRAVLEATAYAVAHNLEAMHAAGGIARRAVAVGGGARSDSAAADRQRCDRRRAGGAGSDHRRVVWRRLPGRACHRLLELPALKADWVRIARHVTPDPARYAIPGVLPGLPRAVSADPRRHAPVGAAGTRRG